MSNQQNKGSSSTLGGPLPSWATPGSGGTPFNAQTYLSTNPDVAAAAQQQRFNAQNYLAANPDVAAAGVDPFQHWQQYGQTEGRQGAWETPEQFAQRHWNDFGQTEGRQGTGITGYNNVNTALQTLPMGAAVSAFQSGGQGPTSRDAMGQLTGMSGTNPLMDSAAGGFTQTGQGAAGNYQSIFNRAGQPGAAENFLTGTAQGNFLNGSPFLQDVINRAAQKQSDAVNQTFGGAGRYGSAAHQGTLADSIGEMTSKLLNDNYQQERNRQLSAAGTIGNEQLGRLGMQGTAAGGAANAGFGAAQGLGQLGQQQFGNKLQSLGAASGLENQGIQNLLGTVSALPNIQQNKIFDANQQQGVGQQVDQYTQQGLNDLINQWQQGDMQDWARLGGLLSAGTGAAGNWGVKTGTADTTNKLNPVSILGGILSLASSSKSDRRFKTDIKPVGKLDNGLTVYAYRYRDGGPTQFGVMADEVEKVVPEAVTKDENGYSWVRYDIIAEAI